MPTDTDIQRADELLRKNDADWRTFDGLTLSPDRAPTLWPISFVELRDTIAAALREARKAGMEEAAVIADTFSHPNPFPTIMGAIASAIRAKAGEEG